MAHLEVDIADSDAFAHSSKEMLLISDISDVRVNFLPLYDDACDVGFALRNPRSGNITRWSLARENRDNENDITSWDFSPAPESVRKQPELRGYRLTLVND